MVENSDEKTMIIRVSEVEGARDDGDFDHRRNHQHDDDGDDEEALMKRMILGHPLFELLIETHINCFKVGLGLDDLEEDEDKDVIRAMNNLTLTHEPNNGESNELSSNYNVVPSTAPELDKFMEAYCMALKRLREAMEEPLKDATSFISNMYKQLDDLNIVTENEQAS